MDNSKDDYLTNLSWLKVSRIKEEQQQSIGDHRKMFLLIRKLND
jgi:hypothetical protein